MLTPEEEDRLEAAFPSQSTVAYDGTSAEFNLTPFWTGPDEVGDDAGRSPDYPMLVFEWENQSAPNADRQPLDNLREVDDDDDEIYLEKRTTEQSSELIIQVVVRSSWQQKLSPNTRLTELTRQVFNICDEQLDQDGSLNVVGPNGERAMTVDVLSGPTPSRDNRTMRSQWRIQLNYRKIHDKEIDSVGEFGVDAEVE